MLIYYLLGRGYRGMAGLILDLLALTLCSHPSERNVDNECTSRVVEEASKFKDDVILGKVQRDKYLKQLIDFAQRKNNIKLYKYVTFLSKLRPRVKTKKKVEVGKWHAEEYCELEELALEGLISCEVVAVVTCEGRYSIISDDLIRKLKGSGIEIQYVKDLCNVDAKVAFYVKGT